MKVMEIRHLLGQGARGVEGDKGGVAVDGWLCYQLSVWVHLNN